MDNPVPTPEMRVDNIITRLQTTANAFVAITKELDLDMVLQLIADSAKQVANSRYAALGIVDEQGVISFFITSGISKEERELIGALPRGHGLLGLLIKEGQPVRVRDISKDPRRCGFPPNHPPMTSLLGMPVSIEGKIVGDLYLTDKIGKSEFDDEDEWWLNLFARQAANAIINANLYNKARQAQKNAQALAEVVGSLNQFTEPHALFDQISKATCQILGLPAAAVFMLDEQVARFSLQAGIGLKQNSDDDTFLPLKGSVAGEVLEQARTKVVSNLTQLDEIYVPYLASGKLPDSLIVVPIREYGKINGVIEAYSQVARQFTPDEIALLEAFAVKASLALEKANLFHQKEEFLSMTAHDLRAPLSAIKMSSGLLAANLPEDFPPLLSQLVENITRNSERLDNLMEDLLDLNRLENGRVHLNLERCEAGELINAAVNSLNPLFEEKSQLLTYTTNSHKCWIVVDRKRMDQILVNLLSNAHKYTPTGGKVTVALDTSESSVVIKVSDNGPGIPPKEQNLIFDRYYRRPVHEQESKISGTGLGLPITRNLVNLHEGKIWVESTPGSGTTFFVQLSIAPFET
ncbi:MAG: GAF domain-containing sensor histidine kinase [Chloroflexi bacterium]|nr:GAF domain-containing sensor histidine kinase [Chloroflexota bacterium]OJW01878.1 MAG: hypothetical protein BGO39_28435 [Chloroflexi bacterium 54-19]